MRVLLIGHSGDMYGASRSLVKLARILSKEHMVYVMLPERGALYASLEQVVPADQILIYPGLYIFSRASFKLNHLPATSVKFVKNISFIAKIISRYNIDAVHTNSGVVPAGALAAKLSGKKHIWHIREWFGDFKKFWPYYSAYMSRFSDKIICVSETMASQFKDRNKAITVYNGFPIPEMDAKTSIPAELREAVHGADLILGCTSRIRLIRKGQEYLIEALGILSAKRAENIQLILIGDYVPGYESQKETIESLIRKYKLEGRIHFLGHLKEPLPYYSLFDVFALPSGEPEPFGGVVIEAMSMGLPVIGSNLGGTTEQVKDGWNGYLFENQNPADLAEKIELFLDDKEKVKVFGERSKERVRELFSLELHERKVLAVYRSM